MTDVPPGWHPDPTQRHHVRFWDGAAWTDHVATAGVADIDPLIADPTARPRRGRRNRLGWIGLVLCTLAVAAIAVPSVSFARISSADGFLLEDGVRRTIEVEPNKTYGIFVDDANNSGYSQQCTAYEADGDPIELKDPPGTFSGSETETLDLVFNTGSGSVTVSCSVPGERVATRPVPNSQALILGILGALALGIPGAVLLIAWLIARVGRQKSA